MYGRRKIMMGCSNEDAKGVQMEEEADGRVAEDQVFNGGSDFNEPVKRCLDRLTEAKWANSDILLVSDGELRQPGQDIMRKLSGVTLQRFASFRQLTLNV